MEKRQYYIRERKYLSKPKKEKNIEKIGWWKKLMGEAFIADLCCNKPEVMAYLENGEWYVYHTPNYCKIKEGKIDKNTERFVMQFIRDIDNEFVSIHASFLMVGYQHFRVKIKNKTMCTEMFREDFLKQQLFKQKSISMRALIEEIHKKGNQYKTGGDENKFRVKQYGKKEDYMWSLLDEYPVLERCLWECVSRNVVFFTEVVNRIGKDKKEIDKLMFDGEGFYKISGIDGNNSDSHFEGRQVLKLKLDNGKSIIYKPHSIENEKWFGEFLNFLGCKCGVKMYFPEIVACEEYGWVECVEQCECRSYEELQRYYYRIGISLFVAYLLGTNDIHYENLIAMGEYPVIVDLESLGKGIKKGKYAKSKYINLELQESVLGIGILPYYHWVQKEKGTDLSALTGGDNNELPFKVPVIKNPGTADMYIDYEYAKLEKAQNHAMLEGKFIPPDKFEQEIRGGFETAFLYTLNNKEEIRKWLSKIEHFKSRYLVGDTQKYSMLLSSSYHPAVMKDAADREFLLYSLWRGRNFSDESDCKIVDAEIYDLLNNDIPYFYFYMNQPHLYDSRGNEIMDYFEEAPIEGIYKRLDSINERDLKRQELFIHLSLSAAGEEQFQKESKYYRLRKMIENPRAFSKRELLNMVENIADKLLEEAELDYGKEYSSLNWFRLVVLDNKCGAVNILPCGMYLYDGLAGILVFLYILSTYSSQMKYTKACETLEQQLFTYTDTVNRSHKDVQSNCSGLYNGEGAVVYTYLILYWISGNQLYIEYAERHAKILKVVAQNDIHCDLLDGKAGAIVVFCYMYLSSNKPEYLEFAELIADKLISEAVDMDSGIGWRQADGGIPLLGMAHGNSGIIVAFSKLYKLTGNKKYYLCIKRALRFEDYNYNFQTGDWLDFRGGSNKVNFTETIPAAWCHGAGGILLSRIMLTEIKMEQEDREQVLADIERAFSYVQKRGLRKEMCLCHGECGNFLISEVYRKWKNKKFNLGIDEKEESDQEEEFVLTKEWYHPGLMNGYTGIGYYLLMQIADIPNFIFMDVKLRTENGKLWTRPLHCYDMIEVGPPVIIHY